MDFSRVAPIRGNNKTLLIESDSRFSDFYQRHADSLHTVLSFCQSLDRTVTRENIVEEEQFMSTNFRDRLLSKATEEGVLDDLMTFMKETAMSDTASESSEENNDQSENHSLQLDRNDTPVKSTDEQTDEIGLNSTKQSLESAPEVIYQRSSVESKEFKEQVVEDLYFQWLLVPLRAVHENRLDILRLCDKTGISLQHFRHNKGFTLLHDVYCKTEANFEMLMFLLEKIDVNVVGDENESVLQQCLICTDISPDEKLRRMQHLLANGADATIRSNIGGSLIASYLSTLLSVQKLNDMDHWKTILNILLKEGVDVNQQDLHYQTALTAAICIVPPSGHEETLGSEEVVKEQLEIRKEKLEIIKYLISNKADPNLKDHSGCTALHIAIANQNIDIIQIILKNRGDVNAVTNVGFSPMYTLVMEIGCPEDDPENTDFDDIFEPIFHSLVESGCKMNAKCIDRSTCLHFAAAERTAVICELLIQNGCDVHARDYLNRTPLHMAARNKDHRVASILIKHGARTDYVDINNNTPIHHACLWENSSVVDILIASGADVNAVGDLNIQPIHLAAENGNESMLQSLLTSGANIHARDNENATPLHYAASDGNPESTQFLLLNGADKSLKDNSGKTALDLSKFRGQYKASTILADNPSDVKFGNIPEGHFPNRPLLRETEIEVYYEKIESAIQKLGGSATDKAKCILDSPGLGKVDLDAKNNKIIHNRIISLATEIFKRVVEIEPLFKGRLINAGSTADKVKIGYPDEFDFVCHLEKISEMIADVQPAETDVYAKIKLMTPVPKEFEKFCIRGENTLNAGRILIHFCRVTRLAVYDILSVEHPNLYFGFLLPHELSTLFSEKDVPMTKLQGLNVSWRGNSFKLLDISIDFNPVVFTRKWPNDAIKSNTLLPDLCDRGMYLIPKHCKKLLSYPPQIIPVTSDLWRYSTHHLEEAMMQKLPPLGRDCYMICKSMRMEPLSCAVDVSKAVQMGQPDMLKNDCVEGFCLNMQEDEKCEGNNLDQGEDENIDVVDDDDDDGDGGALKVYENRWNKSYTIQLSSNQISDILDKDPSALDMLECDENEVSAESCIPSYYIKVLFLNEVDDLYKSQRCFTEKDLQRIPRVVYERLVASLEKEKLCSLFFPTQNIYFISTVSEIDAKKMANLRKKFSKNILTLLTKLGFE